MSIYDIPISSAEGETNFLSKFKGKVSLVVNVTGDCGNAPQYGILETIYNKYKDKGFEIIAVPTNDYCGAGLTYGEHVYGTTGAIETKSFAENTFNVTYSFTELVESNPDPQDLIEGLPSKYGKVKPHELFKTLGDVSGEYMGGNFEKYLIGKNGEFISHYHNGTLLDYNHDRYVEGKRDEDYITGEEAYKMICKDIELALAS